ncbi:MAG: CDP-diacylglycerol--glycerol-3-phosphate 3-phosphatidyltransferase [Rhodospirillales bacterium]
MERNLPNALTLSRIIGAAVVCVLLAIGTPLGNWLALTVYLYACLTDFLDGYLARSRHQQSHFGRMLDPIADKLLVASVLLMLVAVSRLNGVHLLPALVILWREILVSGLREYLAQLRVGIPVTRLAKWKTTLQLTALGFLVVGDALPIGRGWTATDVGIAGLWAAALLTVVTGYDYLRASMTHLGGDYYRSTRPSGIEPIDRARDLG